MTYVDNIWYHTLIMKEIWRPIPFLDGRYEVSDRGRIRRAVAGRRTKAGRIRTLQKNKCGYLHCVLSSDPVQWVPKDVRVHIAVAWAFLGAPPDGKSCVNHIDGDKTNNKPGNLEWCTHRENSLHARDLGLVDDRKAVDQYAKDGKTFIARYASMADASRATGVPVAAISSCCRTRKVYISRVKSVKGFRWAKDADGVKQYDRNGNLIAVYKDYETAATAVGSRSSGAIMQCATGKEYIIRTQVRTACGYHWKFSAKGDSQCQDRV